MKTRIAITVAALAVLATTVSAQPSKPNIVYILVDNWGWGDIRIQGGSVPTPRIDALAQEGLRLTNFNVETQCTPTRSAIMTGRLPIRSGTHQVTYGMPYGLALWEYTLPELLADAGYATAHFGKWHLGDVEGRLPTDQGFDEWFGIKNSSDEAGYSSTPQFDPEVFPQPYIWEGVSGKPSTKVRPFNLESRKTIDRGIVERSEAFIEAQAGGGRPFFLYMAVTQVHPPYGHHPDFDNASGTGIYGDVLMEVDYNVGRILDKLQAAGIEDDTIVILSGDNGTVPDGMGGGSNGPWRGGFTGYEGGVRTVAMVRWPGYIEARRVSDAIFASLDWMPTLAHLVGEEGRIPTDRPIDGVNQADFLLGKQETSNREYVLCYIGAELASVKWRTFKIHFKTYESLWAPAQTYQFPRVYDVANDPGEVTNLMHSPLAIYSWVYGPMRTILNEKAKSMQEFPNIKPGEEFTGYE